MARPAPEPGQEILWLIEGLEGSVEFEAVFEPRPGFGAYDARPVLTAGFAVSGIGLHLDGASGRGHGSLRAGDRWAARLRGGPGRNRAGSLHRDRSGDGKFSNPPVLENGPF